MYGSNAPAGFLTETHALEITPNGKTNTFNITPGVSLFTGDPVTMANTGRITVLAGGGLITGTVLGVFMGCYYYDSSNKYQLRKNWVANTPTYNNVPPVGYVLVDPWHVYNVQVNEVGGLDETDLLDNYSFAYGTGNALTGISGAYLAASAAGPTGCFKVIGLTPNPTNVYGVQYNNALCIINNHYFKGGTGTARP
jgi:hypothetical protein